MRISRRIATLFRVRANQALARAEDPRGSSITPMSSSLRWCRRCAAGLRTALGAGREDLAREALIRRAAATSQISDLQSQQAKVDALTAGHDDELARMKAQLLPAHDTVIGLIAG